MQPFILTGLAYKEKFKELKLTNTADLEEWQRVYAPNDPYTRPDTMGTWDFEGKFLPDIEANTLPIYGARGVTNICLQSQDISSGSWIKDTGVTITGTDGFTADSVGDQMVQIITGIGEWEAVFSFNAKVAAGGSLTNYKIRAYGSNVGIVSIPTLSYTTKRYSVKVTNNPAISGQNIVFGFEDENTSNWAQVTLTDFQVEYVTGQTNQNPSNYIPTTTTAITKFYDTENGNTVSSNIVTETEGDTIESVIGGAFWPSVNNQFVSGEFRNPSAWNTVTCNTTQNYIGVDSLPNMAWTIEDDDILSTEITRKNFVIIDDSLWQSASILIKKDTNTTRYSAFSLNLLDGTTELGERLIINTQTGAVTEYSSDGEYSVFNTGDWWFITVAIQNNTSGNTAARVSLYPAYSKDGITLDITANGSIIVDWAQFCNARRCPVHLVRGGETLGDQSLIAADAVNVSKLIKDRQGYVIAHYQVLPDDLFFGSYRYIITSAEEILYGRVDNDDLRSYDGTTQLTFLDSISGYNKSASYWWEGLKNITSNGASGTAGNYDGSWNDGVLKVGGTGVNTFNGIVSKVIFGAGIKTTQAKMEAATSPIFAFEVKTTESNETFTLPLESTGTYDFTIDWGDGLKNDITEYDQSDITHIYVNAETHDVKITRTITGWRFNNSSSAPKVYEISSWGNLTILPTTGSTFYGCSNMTWVSDAIGGFDTTGLTSTYSMFRDCVAFNSSVDNLDMSLVTTMYSMFYGCTLFDQDLSTFDTSKVENMQLMFYACLNFNSSVANFDTSKVTTMDSMFYACIVFNQDLSNFNMSSATDLSGMLANIDILTTNYSNSLISWESQPHQNNVSFGGGLSTYNAAGAVARISLIADGWAITDGGPDSLGTENVLNSTFDTDLTGIGLSQGTGGDAVVSRETVSPITGVGSLKLFQSTSPSESFNPRISIDMSGVLKSGTPYHVTFDTKLNGGGAKLSSGQGIRLGGTSGDNYTDTVFSGSQSHQVDIITVGTTGIMYLYFDGTYNSSIDLLIDNIIVKEIL